MIGWVGYQKISKEIDNWEFFTDSNLWNMVPTQHWFEPVLGGYSSFHRIFTSSSLVTSYEETKNGGDL
jgi:hypothetical protein